MPDAGRGPESVGGTSATAEAFNGMVAWHLGDLRVAWSGPSGGGGAHAANRTPIPAP
jgi:hypothetical protein